MSVPTRDLPAEYQRATERAERALCALDVLADEPKKRERLSARVELFLWHFLRLRWYDVHLFLESVEPKEAMELVRQGYKPGRIYAFLSARQDDLEWEDAMTVGLSLLFAAMRQARARGFDPTLAGTFTLQRMLEQVLEGVQSLPELLEVGKPP